MCQRCQASVRLPLGQRFFKWPYCWLMRQHPPVFPEHMLDGHVYCDWCGNWAEIENYRTFASEEEFEAAVREALGRQKAKGKTEELQALHFCLFTFTFCLIRRPRCRRC